MRTAVTPGSAVHETPFPVEGRTSVPKRGSGRLARRWLATCVVVGWLLAPAASAEVPMLVRDIDATASGGGTESSSAVPTADLGGELILVADDGVSGQEIWRSDGTASGTVILQDIRAGVDSSFPSGLTVAGSQLFFRARDDATNEELWVSDGTTASRVKDINPGSDGSSLTAIRAIGAEVYFTADDGANSWEPWRSDGTAAGTQLVKDIHPTSGSFAAGFTDLAGTVIFTAEGSTGNRELWKTDGTAAGTSLVKEIHPTAGSIASNAEFVPLGSHLYFAADDGTNGVELWRTDGTSAGTTLVKNIVSGSGSSRPAHLTPVGTELLFGVAALELWKTDGTTAGTVQVADLSTASLSGGAVSSMVEVNGLAVFTVDSGDGMGSLVQLWASDGSGAGTQMLMEFTSTEVGLPAISGLTSVGTEAYFASFESATGQEPWRTDGTVPGTLRVGDIVPGTGSSRPRYFQAVGSTIFFQAIHPVAGAELFQLRPDAVPPRVTLVDSLEATADGEITEGETIQTADALVSRLLLTFDESLADAGSGALADDVSAPANYLLFDDGGDGFDTVDCAAGVAAGDGAVALSSGAWNEVSRTVDLQLASPLGTGSYRLLACGSTTLFDLAGNPLDGNGDGTGGDDFVRSFHVFADADADSVADENDNCPAIFNPDQTDTDADGEGDACDGDDDNDGVADGSDAAPLDPTVCQDLDGDSCDDCAVGDDGFGPKADFDPANDGADADADGFCDAGDIPLNPGSIASTTHTPSAWGPAEITIQWSGASTVDPADLAGYSVSFDTSPTTLPDADIDIAHAADPHRRIRSLTTGQNHYFHLRTCDGEGDCSTAVHLGPFWVDAELPAGPDQPASTSHTESTWSNDPTIDVEWSGASDAHSGVGGYSVAFDGIDPGGIQELLRTWGRGPGVFRDPYDVAVDASGRVFVADSRGGALHRFDRDGHPVSKWRVPGTGVIRPVGLGLDSAGNVYVASESRFLSKLDAEGGLLAQFEMPFGRASDVAIDSAGSVYVADKEYHRIVKLAPDGSQLLSWGAYPDVYQPEGIAVDAADNVYLANTFRNRVEKYDGQGNLLAVFGQGLLSLPSNVHVDSIGRVYVVQRGSAEIRRFDASGTELGSWGASGSGIGEFQDPQGVAVDSFGHVYVADTLNQRIQKFSGTGQPLGRWGVGWDAPGELGSTGGAAVDSSGRIYVVDSFGQRVLKFDGNGYRLAEWGSTGTGNGQFASPTAIAVDAADKVYVVESGNDRIQKFDADGNFLLAWGSSGTGPGQFDLPTDIAVGPLGNVHVVDAGTAPRGQSFDSTGNFLAQWGHTGGAPGELSYPTALAVDATGSLYVGEGSRIVKYDSAGNYLLDWQGGIGGGTFSTPRGLAVDDVGRVHVGSSSSGVKVFDSQGAFLYTLSAVAGAQGVVFDPFGQVIVAAVGTIEVYAPPGIPDAAVEVAHGTDPHSTTSATLSDGQEHFVHLRTCDVVGNCGAARHLGPFWIDATAPTEPSDLASTSHAVGTATSDATIDVEWAASTDATSGLDGYAYAFSAGSTSACDQGKDLEEGATSVTSPALADGSWFFHLCAVDQAGNWSATATAGPFVIDVTSPRVVDIDSVVSAGAAGLAGAVLEGPVTRLLVTFDEEMDPASASDETNYELVAAGADGVLATTACASLQGDDVAVLFATADHDAPSRNTVLSPVGDLALVEGLYRLLACSTLTDVPGNALDGNGDGSGGDPYRGEFRVLLTDRLQNPNFDTGAGGWTLSSPAGNGLDWDAGDLDGAAASGSLRIRNLGDPFDLLSAGQCVDIDPSIGALDLGGAFRIAPGPGGDPLVEGALEFYAADACAGAVAGSLTVSLLSGGTGGFWQPVRMLGLVGPSAESVRVRFQVDANGDDQLQIDLDALFFGATSILFEDGFESGGTSAWSATVGE